MGGASLMAAGAARARRTLMDLVQGMEGTASGRPRIGFADMARGAFAAQASLASQSSLAPSQLPRLPLQGSLVHHQQARSLLSYRHSTPHAAP